MTVKLVQFSQLVPQWHQVLMVNLVHLTPNAVNVLCQCAIHFVYYVNFSFIRGIVQVAFVLHVAPAAAITSTVTQPHQHSYHFIYLPY